LAHKLETIVMDDPPGDTKSMDDMVSDEINNIGSFNFSKWYSFRPFREVIGYSENEPMISSRWRTD